MEVGAPKKLSSFHCLSEQNRGCSVEDHRSVPSEVGLPRKSVRPATARTSFITRVVFPALTFAPNSVTAPPRDKTGDNPFQFAHS